ncbi:MAG TPA: chromosomal replication initiator protein DnaA, partial [Dongiaceae bacterium]|nr:chromosomal replication initiator protein DnaA [Dongiaceae bacterium]
MAELGTDNQLNAQWARVRGRLRAEFGEATFRSWLKPLTLAGRRGPDLRVAVPSRFMRDWVATHYADRLKTLWSNEDPDIRSVEVIVDATQAEAIVAVEEAPEAPHIVETVAEDTLDAGEAEGEILDDWSGNLDPRLTFENFVVGKSNELAQAAAYRVAEADQVPFNPLFLYGGVGLGKTHLMHAIAWHIRRKRPDKRVIYLSAEKFMYQFIRALRNKDTMAFKERFRTVDVLMVDDVQFIIGKESTQEEFFHTFNALFDQNRQVVLSADKSPSDLQGLEERMRTRFGWGLVADIHPTTY